MSGTRREIPNDIGCKDRTLDAALEETVRQLDNST